MGTKEEEKIAMRKRNMKIFPMYKSIAWDYLFYYTIDFLFLTQVKNISASNVILKNAFYSIFAIFVQVPANIVIEFLGRKNSIVLGNILNCLYIAILMLSRNLGDLIFAEFIQAIAFSIKEAAQPSLLGASIPPSRYKSSIYSKINAKGTSRFYLFNAISKIIGGYLFTVNGYLPMALSLVTCIISTIFSLLFIEPIKKKRVKADVVLGKEQLKQIKDGFIYTFRSERLKALILCGALVASVLAISDTYHVSLLEDLNVSAIVIGITSAVGSLLGSISAKLQEKFHQKRRNKSLMTIAFTLSFSCIIAGISGIIAMKYAVFIAVIILTCCLLRACDGMYRVLIDKYLSNFANKHIDTKIFSAQQLFTNLTKAIMSMFSAFLIARMTTAYCMIIMGCIFTLLFILVSGYMKTRVGLKPDQYSKEETKYDELKEIKESLK